MNPNSSQLSDLQGPNPESQANIQSNFGLASVAQRGEAATKLAMIADFRLPIAD
jgi:hypothetical protein